MKCCAAKETPLGFKPCARLAKPQVFDAFCSKQHQEDAKQFVGNDAYSYHMKQFSGVLEMGTSSMMKTFNKTIRPMFVSMIVAQKKKVEQVALQSMIADYSAGVQTAWSGVSSVSAVDIQQLQNGLQNAQQAITAVKRERDNVAELSRMLCLTDSETSSRSSKRSKDSVVSDDDATTSQSDYQKANDKWIRFQQGRKTPEERAETRAQIEQFMQEKENEERENEYTVDEPEDMQE